MTNDSAVRRRAEVRGGVHKAFLGRLTLGEHASPLLDYLSGLGRWVGITGNVAQAGLLLVVRLWLGQAVFVHQVMVMLHAEGFAHAPPAGDMLIPSVAPLLLAMGLSTRPIALILVLGTGMGGTGNILAAPRTILLIWLLTQGAGPLSIDFLLRSGLARVPIWPVRVVNWLYACSDRVADLALPCGTRLYLALAIAGGAGVAIWPPPTSGEIFTAPWWAILLCSALIFGVATRFVGLLLCGLAPLIVLSGTMPDQFDIMLLMLMVTARGAGKLSLDELVARWINVSLGIRGRANEAMPHIVVVGGGFGGIAAVRALRWAACRVTLVDRRNHYLFQPLLYQVATAALSPADIAIPIRSIVRGQQNIAVRLSEVVGVDPVAREVILANDRIPFDYLILATGAQHSYFGREEWAVHAPGLKNIEDATAMRSRMLRAFEEAENEEDPADRMAWLTFVVVGGGPTGVELAGALAEFARTGLDQEYRIIDPTTTRVILVQSAPRVLPAFSPLLSVHAERSLRELGVEVQTGAKVTHIDQEGVEVDGERIAARTTFWAAGVAASPAAKWLRQIGDKSGRIIVNNDLSVPGCPGIFAIGDTAASNGWAGVAVPGLAPAAKQQGRHVARVIKAAINGHRSPGAFRYQHHGNLATIGRLAAVAELHRIRLWGAPAWWLWGIAHVLLLAGGRNRAAVVLNWLWAYLTYRRSTRLITGLPGDA